MLYDSASLAFGRSVILLYFELSKSDQDSSVEHWNLPLYDVDRLIVFDPVH